MKRVLAPLDGTKKAELALPYLRLACAPGDSIVLLAVRKPAHQTRIGSEPGQAVPGALFGPSGGVLGVVTPDVSVFQETKDQAIERLRTETKEYLENLSTNLRHSGYQVETEVLIDDDAAEAILDYARQMHPTFIVMMRRTHFDIGALVFGGVATKIAHADIAPVIFVPSA